jgi:hypothetical protein
MQATEERSGISTLAEQYLLALFIGQATVSATKCSLYEKTASSPRVKRFFAEQRNMLEATVKRLRSLLDQDGDQRPVPAQPTDLDLLLDWHKDTVAAGGGYFSASFQVPTGKTEQEFVKLATASKAMNRTLRDLIIDLGGTVT